MTMKNVFSIKLLWTLLFACLLLVFGHEDHKIITAEAGQKNVTLTCRAPNNNNIVVKWTRADMKSEYVFLYRDEVFVPDEQHPSFKNRVDLQDRQMKDGDVSLILKDVTINDTGTYECRVIQRVREPMRLIKTIYLRVVDPPGQTGGHTEDGGKKDRGKEDGVSSGHPGLIVGVIVFGVMVALVIFITLKTSLKQNTLQCFQ